MNNSKEKKCNRCDAQGHPYQAYKILSKEEREHYKTSNKLSAYRCFCFFCDEHIKVVMIEHPNILYERTYINDDEKIDEYKKRFGLK